MSASAADANQNTPAPAPAAAPTPNNARAQEASAGVRSVEAKISFYLFGGLLVLVSILLTLTKMYEDIAMLPAFAGSLILGSGLLVEAFKELKENRLSNATLASIAIFAAIVTEQYIIAGVVAFILLMFDLAVRRTAWGARRAIEELVTLTPDTARVVVDGNETEGPLSVVKVGDIVRVRPGENLPVDGEIVSGSSTINQASLTGEALPIEVELGSQVYAGTSNINGQIDLRVTSVGEDTTIGKVATLITEAETSKSDRQLMIEQVAKFFVPIVLATAFVVWFGNRDSENGRGVQLAITVLIVATPSALLIASPSAMVAAFAAAARLGIMVKETGDLEAAANCDTIIFDKTGTLTTGKFEVSRLVPAEGVDGAALLRAAANAEKSSNHPIATSIMATASQARIETAPDTTAEEVPGKGVLARFASGEETLAGRAQWLRESGGNQEQIDSVEQQLGGITAVHVMHAGQYLGAVGLEDRLRRSSKGVVEVCRTLGARAIMLVTGDRFPVAERVGRTVGVDRVEAECLPEEKHEIVTNLVAKGSRVLMVGDGINDGPSLAAADVGVAMGLSGSDIATNSAGIALMTDEIGRVPFLIQLARKSKFVIAQNITISLLVAIIGLVLAATGQFDAVVGGVGLGGGIVVAVLWHFLGDLLVLGNSFRLFRFGEDYADLEQAEGPQASSTGNTSGPRSATYAPAN